MNENKYLTLIYEDNLISFISFQNDFEVIAN